MISFLGGSAEFTLSSHSLSWAHDGWGFGFDEFTEEESYDNPLSVPPPPFLDVLAGNFRMISSSNGGRNQANEWGFMIVMPFWVLMLIYSGLCGCAYFIARRRLIKNANQIAQQGAAPNPGDG
jgi:hypothetical protein